MAGCSSQNETYYKPGGLKLTIFQPKAAAKGRPSASRALLAVVAGRMPSRSAGRGRDVQSRCSARDARPLSRVPSRQRNGCHRQAVTSRGRPLPLSIDDHHGEQPRRNVGHGDRRYQQRCVCSVRAVCGTGLRRVVAASETATPGASPSARNGIVQSLTNSLRTALEAKPERVSLVELKNGKLLVKQKPISFEKMSETLQGACLVASSCPHASTHKTSPITTAQRSYNSEKWSKSG